MLKINKKQKGLSIYLALVIITVFLAMGLGLTTILMSQKKMIRAMDYSIIALAAADSGVERMLYLDKECHETGCSAGYCKTTYCSGVSETHFEEDVPLTNSDAKFTISIDRDCGVQTISSGGEYMGVKRSLEVVYGESKVGSRLNEATGDDCTTFCQEMYDCGCGSIGLDAGGSDTKYWIDDGFGVCFDQGGGGCSTLMNDDGLICPLGGYRAKWTNCRCQ